MVVNYSLTREDPELQKYKDLNLNARPRISHFTYPYKSLCCNSNIGSCKIPITWELKLNTE